MEQMQLSYEIKYTKHTHKIIGPKAHVMKEKQKSAKKITELVKFQRHK